MKADEIKVGMILFNPETKNYIQIKEITRYKSDNRTIACIIASEETEYLSDSQTAVMRQILTLELIHNYFYLDPISF